MKGSLQVAVVAEVVAEAVAESEAGGLTHVCEGLGGRIKELSRELERNHDDSQA